MRERSSSSALSAPFSPSVKIVKFETRQGFMKITQTIKKIEVGEKKRRKVAMSNTVSVAKIEGMFKRIAPKEK